MVIKDLITNDFGQAAAIAISYEGDTALYFGNEPLGFVQ
jgi:hypothetical protein